MAGMAGFSGEDLLKLRQDDEEEIQLNNQNTQTQEDIEEGRELALEAGLAANSVYAPMGVYTYDSDDKLAELGRRDYPEPEAAPNMPESTPDVKAETPQPQQNYKDILQNSMGWDEHFIGHDEQAIQADKIKREAPKYDLLKLEYPAAAVWIDLQRADGKSEKEIRQYLHETEALTFLQYGEEADKKLGRTEETWQKYWAGMNAQKEAVYIDFFKDEMKPEEVRDILRDAEVTGVPPSLLFTIPEMRQKAREMAGEKREGLSYYAAGIRNMFANLNKQSVDKSRLELAEWEQKLKDEDKILQEAEAELNLEYGDTPRGQYSKEKLLEIGRGRINKFIEWNKKNIEIDEQDVKDWYVHVRPSKSAIGRFLFNAIENSGMTIMSGLRSGAAWALGGPLFGALMTAYNTYDESRTEAGGAFVAALEKGMSDGEAYNEARKVLWKNLGTLAITNSLGDIGIFALSHTGSLLSKAGFKGTGKLLTSLTASGEASILSRIAQQIGNKTFAAKLLQQFVVKGVPFIAGAIPEGIEEWLQDLYQMQATGENIDYNQLADSFWSGVAQALLYSMAGIPVNRAIGAVGNRLYVAHAKRTLNFLPEDMRADMKTVLNLGGRLDTNKIKPEDVLREERAVLLPKSAITEEIRNKLNIRDSSQDGVAAVNEEEWNKFAEKNPDIAQELNDVIQHGTYKVTAQEEFQGAIDRLSKKSKNALYAATPKAEFARKAAEDLAAQFRASRDASGADITDEQINFQSMVYGHYLLASSERFGVNIEEFHRTDFERGWNLENSEIETEVDEDGNQRRVEYVQGIDENGNKTRDVRQGGVNFSMLEHSAASIHLTPNANASTFLHELSHIALDDLLTYGNREGVRADVKKDLGIVQKFLRITDVDFKDYKDARQNYDIVKNELEQLLADPDNTSSEEIKEVQERLKQAEEKRDQLKDKITEAHELWARTGEEYFRTGIAPNAELQGVFNRIRNWMLKIYEGVRSIAGVSAPWDIKEVFDRMFTLDTDVENMTIDQLMLEEALLGERLKEFERASGRITPTTDSFVTQGLLDFLDQKAFYATNAAGDEFKFDYDRDLTHGYGAKLTASKAIADYNRVAGSENKAFVLNSGRTYTYDAENKTWKGQGRGGRLSSSKFELLTRISDEIDKPEYKDFSTQKEKLAAFLKNEEEALKQREQNGEDVKKEQAVIDWAKNNIKDISNISKGTAYAYEIPENNKLLDWDKPLNEQSGMIIKRLKNLKKDLLKQGIDEAMLDTVFDDSFSGKDFYELLGELLRPNSDNKLQSQAVSEILGQYDIPGLTYIENGEQGFTVWNMGAVKFRMGADAAIEMQKAKAKMAEISNKISAYTDEIEFNKGLLASGEDNLVEIMAIPQVFGLAAGQNLQGNVHTLLTKMATGMFRYHPEIKRDNILPKIPRAVSDPIAIFASKQHPENNIVVMTDIKDRDGATVVADFYINAQEYGYSKSRIASIYAKSQLASVYSKNEEWTGKTKNQWFIDQINEGRLLYINKDKFNKWLLSSGLAKGISEKELSQWVNRTGYQLPAALTTGKVYNSIPDETSLVKLRQDNDTFYQTTRVSIPQAEIDDVRSKYQNTELWLKAPNGKSSYLSERAWLQVRTPSFKNWFGDWEKDPENASKVVDENGEPRVVWHGSNRGGFSVFDTDGYASTRDTGAWFTSEYKNAETYSGAVGALAVYEEDGEIYPEEGEANYPVFLNIRNPYIVEANGRNWNHLGDLFIYDNEADEIIAEKPDGSYFLNKDDAYDYIEEELGDKYHERYYVQGDEWTTNDIAMEVRRGYYGDYDGVIFKDIIDGGSQFRGYDGENDVYVAFNPEQIKSATDNRGTFNPSDPDIFNQIQPLRSDGFLTQAQYDYFNQIAWHGTRHKILGGRFDLTKIGTGEGAQVYGWGIYLSEDKRVAQHYKKVTGFAAPIETFIFVTGDNKQFKYDDIDDSINRELVYSLVEHIANKYRISHERIPFMSQSQIRQAINEFIEGIKDDIERYKYEIEKVPYLTDYLKNPLPEDIKQDRINSYSDKIQSARQDLRAIKRMDIQGIINNKGNVYKVDIPEDDVLACYESSMEYQSQYVKTAIKRLLADLKKINTLNLNSGKLKRLLRNNIEFSTFYNLLSGLVDNDLVHELIGDDYSDSEGWDAQGGDRFASMLLNAYGIPGLMYFGDRRIVKEGARNFVIWNAGQLKIMGVEGYAAATESRLYDSGTGDTFNQVGNREKASKWSISEGLTPIEFDTNGGLFDNIPNETDLVNLQRGNDTFYQALGQGGAYRLDLTDIIEERRGARSRINALEQARLMEINEASPQEIKFKTGWERGRDGRWRYEILDGNLITDGIEKDKPMKLPQVYDNPELYRAYPELRGMRIVFTKLDKKIGGDYAHATKTIRVNLDISQDKWREILVHEIQHAIQHLEGFAHGMGVKESEIPTRNHELYRRNAGEAEAFDVQARASWDADRRSESLILYTRKGKRNYVDPKNQIVVINGREVLNPTYDEIEAFNQTRTPNFKTFFGDWENNPKEASKVVDKDGQPLVVWHGTEQGGFSEFRTGGKLVAKGTGAWFTSNRENASTYSGVLNSLETYNRDGRIYAKAGASNYPVYLNIRNPYVVDGAGRPWSNLGDLHIYDEETGTVITKKNDNTYFINKGDAYDYIEAELGDKYHDRYSIRGNEVSTNKITADVRNGKYGDNYDGVIFKNIVDFGGTGYNGVSDVFVVFNPEQIKSAYSNSGAFNPNDPNIFNQIGRQRKIEMSDALAERRTDLSERQRAETIAEIEKLSEKIKKGGSPKIESAAVNWVLNGHITLPKDNDKIWDAMRVCEQKHLNPLDFKDPNDILVEYTYRLQPDNMRTDPDKVDAFSDKQVLPNGIVTYKVEDSEAGQKAVREVIDTNWGKEANPWCLTAVDREGKFIPSAWNYWASYNAYDKRIAFLDGHLLAFSANNDERVRWWDKWDNYSGLVPNIITGRLKDESYDLDNSKKRLEIKNGRVRWFRYDEQNSLDVEIDIKSNQATKYFKDGTKFKGNVSELYADFKPKEIVKEIEDKDDKNKKLQTILRLNSDGTPDSIQYADNTFKSWFKNGQIKTERLLDGTVRTYYDNKEHTLRVESLPDKTYREWYESGVLSLENLPDGTQRAWYENGNLKRERLPDFTYREWYENGNKKSENFLDGTVRQWYETGKLKHEQLPDGTHRHWRENGRLWNEILPDGTQREWYENGQKRSEALPNGHSYRWYSTGELEVHNYNGKNLQYSIGYRQDGTRRSSYRSDYGWVDYYENNRPCKTTLLDKTVIEHFRNGRLRHIIHPDGREEFFNSRGIPVERKSQNGNEFISQGIIDTLNQEALHGTPHNLGGTFDLKKINTGEGAQAYGWGIYLAENSFVAGAYRLSGLLSPAKRFGFFGFPIEDSITETNAFLNGSVYKIKSQLLKQELFPFLSWHIYQPLDKEHIKMLLDSAASSIEHDIKYHEKDNFNKEQLKKAQEKEKLGRKTAKRDIKTWTNRLKLQEQKIKELKEALRELKFLQKRDFSIKEEEFKGNLYRVDIPENDVLLDWDKPLSQNPAYVIKAINQVIEDLRLAHNENLVLDDAMLQTTGKEFYRLLGRILGSDKAASMMLNKHGVPGLRYFDGLSREKQEGTHNFVIWDEKQLKIIGVEGLASEYENYNDDIKASNDKRSNLIERVWQQVRTAAFKKWFGDWESNPELASKVIDENGEPLIVWHGTEEGGFDKFKVDGAGATEGTGAWFSSSPNIARVFSKGYSAAKMYAVFLNLRNPYIFDCEGRDWKRVKRRNGKFFSTDDIVREVKAGKYGDGYDGVIFKNIVDGSHKLGASNVYVAFKPNQIKSAFNNAGTFNSRKYDIFNQIVGKRGAINLDAADGQNRLDNLEVAREMEIAGKTAREIKSATGWERGKDTKWRYEIPDGKLKINEEDFKDGYITTLGKLYNSPKLYKAYPELRKLRVYFEHLPFGETAETLLGENIQDIRLIFDPREFYTGGLVHEIQHVIQIIEGFARGGSSDSVLRGEVLKYTNEEYERLLNTEPLSYEDYISTRFFFNDEEAQAAYSGYVKRIKENPERVLRPKAAYNVYNKLSGEVEARNADRRLEYKPRERKNSLLLDTEDVAREDQIAIFNQIAGKRGAANLDAADGQNRLKNLETAREMEIAGKTAKEIRYATGWERGADKNWRYEIDDGKFDAGFFDKVQETIKRRFVDKKLFSFRGFSNNAKLGDIYHNPELYKAYPKLKKLKVSFMAYHINGDPVFKGMYIASRFPFSNEILINTVPIHFYKYDLNKVQEILVHEIQHAIQDVEGFAPYSEISAPLNDEYNRRAAEEVEARNAETRLKLTPKDRKEYLLEETEDVAREDQIIIFNQLSKQRRADFTKLLNERRPDLADEGLVESTVEEIDNLSLSDDAKNRNLSPNKVQLAAGHWLSNSESLRLPEDGYKILDGLELCNKKKVQYQDITNLNAFLRRFTQKEIDKAVRLNPDTLPEFSNKVEYNIDDKKAGKHKITVYTVQDDKTGQKAVRRVINSHWGEKSNPWCLVRGDDNGNLITEGTASALKYWEQYNGTKKRIAFLDGKLSAFSANEGHDVVWWNSIDWASEGIPFTVKKDKETISFEYREADNKIVPFKSKIDDDTETEYYDNGMPRVIYYPDEVREAFYRTGELLSRFFPEAQDAPQCTEYYFKTGQLRTRQYLDGTFEEFDINGKNISDSMRRFYIDDRLWCEELSDGSKVIYDYDEFDNEYIKGIHRPDGEFITINGLKNLPDGTIQTIRDGQLLSELDPQGITWVYKNGKRVRANSADTLNQIGKVRRTEMAEILNKKRQDLTEDQRADIIDEVERLGEQVKQGGSPNTEKIAFAWAVKGHIILPEDNSKILQAIKIAKQEHIDPLSYDDPNEILAEFAINDELEDAINPDTVPEFTNKQELPNGLTVYDVQDSKEGQLAVRKIINSHFGVDANPWCLAAGDEYGDLTDEAWEYWSDNYEGSKRIAFKDGKLTAFYAEGSDNLWWNRQDKSSSGIPFSVKIPHGTAELLYNEESGEFTKSREVIRLSKDSKVEREFQNGVLYREKDFKKVKTKNRDGQEISEWRRVSWRRYDIDTKKIAAEQRPDGNYFAYYDYDTQDIDVHKSPDGTTREYYEGSYGKQLKAEEKPDGTKRRWYANGQLSSEYIPQKHNREWYENGKLKHESIYKDNKIVSKKGWYRNGNSMFEDLYDVVKGIRESREWYEDGTLESETIYDLKNRRYHLGDSNGAARIFYRYWYPNGQLKSYYKETPSRSPEHPNYIKEEYLENGNPEYFRHKLTSSFFEIEEYTWFYGINIVERRLRGDVSGLYRFSEDKIPQTIAEVEKLENVMYNPDFDMAFYNEVTDNDVYYEDKAKKKLSHIIAYPGFGTSKDYVWNYKLNRVEEYSNGSGIYKPEYLAAVYPFSKDNIPQSVFDVKQLERKPVEQYDTFNQSQEIADLPFEDDEYLSPDAVKDVDGWLQWNDEYQNKLNSYKNEREAFRAIRNLGGIRYADLVELLGEDLARDLRSLFPTLLRAQKGREQLPLDVLLQNLNEQTELSIPKFEYADDFIDWLYKTAERRPKRPAPIVEINSETEDVLINRLGLDGAREYVKTRRTYLNDMQKRVFAEYNNLRNKLMDINKQISQLQRQLKTSSGAENSQGIQEEIRDLNKKAKELQASGLNVYADLQETYYEQKEIEKFLSELKDIETQAKREVEGERRANMTDEERDMEDAYWAIWDEMKREKAANTRRENLHDSAKRESVPIDEAFKRGYAMAERYSKEAYEAGIKEGRARQTAKYKKLEALNNEKDKLTDEIKRAMKDKNIIWHTQQEIKKLIRDYNSKEDKKMSDLRALHEQVSKLRERGKHELTVKNNKVLENAKNIRNELVSTMKGKKKDWDKSRFRRILDRVNATILGSQRFFDMLDGGKFKFNGPWIKYFVDAFNEAQDKKLRNILKRREWLTNKLKEFGLSEYSLGNTRKIDVPKFRGEPWTVDRLMSIYAGLKNEKSRAAILYGNFANAKNEQEALEWATKCVKALTDNERAFADAIMEEYEMNYKRIHEELVDIYNEGMGHEKNYTPMRRIEINSENNLDYLDTAQVLIRHPDATDNRRARVINGVGRDYSRERVNLSPNKQTPIDLGLYGIWNNQVEFQEHSIAYARPLRDVRLALTISVEGARGTLQQTVKNVLGKSAWRFIENHLSIMAENKTLQNYDVLDGVVGWMAKNMTNAYLCGNLATILKQTTSIGKFIPYCPPHYLIKSLHGLLRRRGRFLNECYDLDPQLKAREGNITLQMLKAGEKFGAWGKATDMGKKPIEWADRVTAAVGFKAVYDYHIAKGESQEEAAREAQRSVLLTQTVTHIKDAPMLYQQKGLLKLSLIFTNDLAQTFGISAYDLAAAIRGGNVPKFMYTILGGALMATILGYIVQGGPDDDNDESFAEFIGKFLTRQGIESIPLIGKGILSLWDNNGYIQRNNDALLAPVAKLYNGVRKLVKGGDKKKRKTWNGVKEQDDNNTANAILDIVEGVALGGVPIPSTAIKRGYKASQDAWKGEFKKAGKRLLGQEVKEKKKKKTW